MNFRKIIKLLFALLFVLIFVLSVIHINEVKQSVIQSAKTAFLTIIPSLFVSCTLANIISKCGIIEFCFKKLKINPQCLKAFIIGNLGGYPIGAKLITELLNDGKISKIEAECSIIYSFHAGPAFIFGGVSAIVFNNKFLGYICFASIFISNLVIFLFDKTKCKNTNFCNEISFSTETVLSSVKSATDAMISIASTIVFFSAIKGIFQVVAPEIWQNAVISTLLEISGVFDLKLKGAFSFSTITALLAFGGVCIQMQILAIVGGKFLLKNFYISRFLQITLSFLLSYAGYSFAIKYLPIACTTPIYKISQSESMVPFVCVCLMMFIAFTYKERHTN